jgi:hypothetical protein
MPYNMLERIHPHKTTQTDIQSSSTNHISNHHYHAPTVETMCIFKPHPNTIQQNQTHTNQPPTPTQLTANQHEPTTTIHLRTITPPLLYPTPNVNKTLLTIHQSSDNKVFRVKYL